MLHLINLLISGIPENGLWHKILLTFPSAITLVSVGTMIGLLKKHRNWKRHSDQAEVQIGLSNEECGNREQAERPSNENADRFHTLFSQSPIGISIMRNGISLYVNPAYVRMFGYQSAAEIVGTPILDRVAPCAREQIAERFRSVERNEPVPDMHEAIGLRKDGTDFPYQVHTAAIALPDGPARVAFIIDIKERRLAENALTRVNRALRVVSGCNQILIHCRSENELLNQVCRLIVEEGNYKLAWIGSAELDEGKLVKPIAFAGFEDGYLSSVIISWDANSKWGNGPTGKAIRTGKASVMKRIQDDPTYARWREQATMRGYASSIAIPLISSGTPVGVLNIYAVEPDAFDAEEIELLTELADDLAFGIMSLRTDAQKQKIETALANAQKLESLGVLAGGIAHDFNNLLAGILGHLEMAQQVTSEPSAREDLTRALAISNRARGLTHQLLTFAKGGTPVKKVINVADLIKEAAEFSLSGSEVKGEFDIPGDLWLCEIDPSQIGQVVGNIVINAQQAMLRGGTIIIRARNHAHSSEDNPLLQSGKYVSISFEDSGSGIPKKDLPKIFDPFFTTKDKGTGLGLTIVYSIIRRHGGYVDVDSIPGKGTKISVLLPAVEKASPDSVLVAKESPFHGQGKVLVMDDESAIRSMTAKMLIGIGYSVKAVEDGKMAIDAFEEAKASGKPFDIVILDLTIRGGVGGKETIGRLRQIDAGIRAIVSSGYSADDVMANPRGFGFDAALSKPYDQSGLIAALKSVIA